MTEAFNDNYEIVREILKAESDRGCVIVSQALLEESLEKRLKSRLAPSPENKDVLFSAYSPLGTFAAKIDVAYRIGIISFHTRSYLHSIRGLRNDFAHSSSALTFQSQSVKNRVEKLFEVGKSFLDYIGYIMKESIVARHKLEYYPEHSKVLVEIEGKYGMDVLLGTMSHREIYEMMAAVFIVVLQDVSSISQISTFPPSNSNS